MSDVPLSQSGLHRQELLQLALAAAGLVITEHDAERQVVHFPPPFRELWGVDAESPQSFEALVSKIHPDDLAQLMTARNQMLADVGWKTRLEYRLVDADGAVRWIESFGGAMRMADGSVRVVMAHRDVTATRASNDALRESEERLRLAVQSGQLGVWDWDVVRDVAMAYGMEDILGTPNDSSPGGFVRWQTEIVHPDDLPRLQENFKAIMAGKDDASNCYRIIRPNGEVRWIDSGGRAYRDAEGKIIRMLGFCRDVTDRLLTEQRNRELTDFLNRARDAIVVQDVENRVVFWNQGAQRLFGWTSDEVLGFDARTLVWRDCRPSITEQEQQLFDRGEFRGDVEVTMRSGETRVLDVGWTLVSDDAGRPRAKLCVAADVTERRLWEKQSQRAERLASLGALAGGVAHDINNALAPIQLAVDLLREPVSDADRDGLLDQAAACVARAAGLVRRILDFAGNEEGERQPIEPAELVEHVAEVLRTALPPSIELHVEVAPNIGRVIGDFNQLAQVLTNLCHNARDAMPTGGRLTLRADAATRDVSSGPRSAGADPADKPTRWIALAVTDEGSGVAPEDLDRIFDPFFSRRQAGRGLGLSVVQSIVQRHGGVVNVESKVGRGSTFSVLLPATDHAPVVERQADRTLQAMRVLLVDSAEEVRGWSRKTLEDFGCRVLTAADGPSAVAAFERHRSEIGLAIVELLMPTDEDCSVVETLRKVDPNVPIIAACGLSDVRTESQRVGADGFLEKPFSPQSLLRTLHDVLRRSSPE